MKRKTKTGVKLLTQVIDRMKPQQREVKKDKDEKENKESNGKISATKLSTKSFKKEPIDDDKHSIEAIPNTSTTTFSPGDEKDYIYPLLFIYRAYGYIVLEEYDKGLKDFLKS